MPNFNKSAGDMQPVRPTEADGDKKRDKLFGTIAHDDPDCISGTNEQKPWRGGSGKPSGPFGKKGMEF